MYHRYHIYTIDTIDTLILFSFPKGFSITRVAPDRLRHTPFFRGGASRSDSRRTWGRHGTRYETPSNIDWKQQIMEIMYSHPPQKKYGGWIKNSQNQKKTSLERCTTIYIRLRIILVFTSLPGRLPATTQKN